METIFGLVLFFALGWLAGELVRVARSSRSELPPSID